MSNTCWIPEATHTHAEYAILIAFPLQQCLTRTRLNVTLYVHCLSCFKVTLAPHIACLLSKSHWHTTLPVLFQSHTGTPHCLSYFKVTLAPHIFSNPSEIVFNNSVINIQKLLNNLTFIGPCSAIIFQYTSNKMQRYTVYFVWKLLHMFRVVPPPIIRSAYNCMYSIWYLSHRYCYLPISRQVAVTDGWKRSVGLIM